MQFLRVALALGNVAGLLIGLYVFDEGETPAVGLVLASVSIVSTVRMVFDSTPCFRSYWWLDLEFALFYIFGLYEGGCWMMWDGELYGLGVIAVCISAAALVCLGSNYVNKD